MKFGSFVVALVVLAAGFAATGCGATPTSSSTVSAIVVTGLVPGVGGSSQFAASAALTGGTTQDVTSTATWSSSNSAVATVSASGLVTAVASGTAVITATYSNVAGTDSITVP